MAEWKNWKQYKNNFEKCEEYQSVLVYGDETDRDIDIAVMIPTFKRSALLKQAVDSVLRQTGDFKYTIFVIDNCDEIDSDTDDLMKEYCKKYACIKYYRNQKNLGMFGNWNRCIELAPTPWLCILNDDDMLKESFLEKVIPVTRHTNCGLFGTYRELLDERTEEEKQNKIQHGWITKTGIDLFIRMNAGRVIPMMLKDVVYNRHFPCNPLILNKEKSMKVGGFNDDYKPFADMVFTANMFARYGACILPERLTVCRFSQNESTKMEPLWAIMETASELAVGAARELGYARSYAEKARQEAVLIEYNVFPSVKYKIDLEDVIIKFKLNSRFRNVVFRNFVMLKYKLGWAFLFFRKNTI